MSTDSEKSEGSKQNYDFDDFGDDWPVDKMIRPDADGDCSSCSVSENAIRTLEEEQEMLTSSLMSLTTHFAQVQLRLRQIMEAKSEQRDDLLKGLVDFAFSGIPELGGNAASSASPSGDESSIDESDRQRELIDSLKSQLEELEKYAYESGAGTLPQSILVEKQKVIIDEIKSKINLHLDETDFPQLSPDDLKKQIGSAFGEFVSPLKMKEQLVTQLKTQITDLERFIKFLQIDAGGKKGMKAKSSELKCECSHAHAQQPSSSVSSTHNGQTTNNPSMTLNGKAINLLDKMATMLQFFAVSQFGCASQNFQMNTLKKTHNHWGDLRAQLEVDVQEVIMLVTEINKLAEEEEIEQQVTMSTKKRTNSTSSYESCKGSSKTSSPELTALNSELTSLVRKRLAISIEKLMEHGLRGQNETTSIIPFIGCFSHMKSDYEEFSENEADYRQMHVWELILEYYHIKNGDQYNETPARMLSQSFNLDIVPSNPQSNKQSLLGAIGTVITLHGPYKRSYNAHFKAFISAALNSKKLTQWLHIIFQCKDLVRTYYAQWSYVRNTGFQDALKCLDQLSKYDFELPIDLAIRQFENITDMFL